MPSKLNSELTADFAIEPLYKGFGVLLTPKDGEHERSSTTLAHLIEKHQDALLDILEKQGGFMVRGFDIDSPQQFEAIALAVEPNLSNVYMGTSPRKVQPGCKYVFSASEFPWYVPIAQHCEISFTPHPPRKIGFCCTAPPEVAGETPLADFASVYDDIRPELREKWEERGLRYRRVYGDGSHWTHKFDPTISKSWPDLFGTTDKSIVEKQCKEEGYTHEWTRDNSLVLTNDRPAVITHKASGRKVWFNHVHIFDKSMIFGEVTRANQYRAEGKWSGPFFNLPVIYWFLYCVFAIIHLLKALLRTPHELSVTFADGGVIPVEEIEEVRDVIWANRKFFKWEKGDVVFLDNKRVSHGRMPFWGKRSVVVSWC